MSQTQLFVWCSGGVWRHICPLLPYNFLFLHWRYNRKLYWNEKSGKHEGWKIHLPISSVFISSTHFIRYYKNLLFWHKEIAYCTNCYHCLCCLWQDEKKKEKIKRGENMLRNALCYMRYRLAIVWLKEGKGWWDFTESNLLQLKHLYDNLICYCASIKSICPERDKSLKGEIKIFSDLLVSLISR